MVGTLGSLIGDTVWYAIGRSRGSVVLRLLCKISLNPETCVRRSSEFISRHGSASLLFSKFIPGISTVAVPLAANSEISGFSFFCYDVAGAVLYIGAYLTAGRIIGDRMDQFAGVFGWIKNGSILLAMLAAVAFLGWRFYQRRRFHADSTVPRVTPEELQRLVQQQQNPYIIDLRHPLDMLTDPRMIPGAVRMSPAELPARQHEIPRDREIILYCT
jgi:membrane protein DedA with SNARE-associated domain